MCKVNVFLCSKVYKDSKISSQKLYNPILSDTYSHAQEGYITVALAVQYVSYQRVKQHNTNQRGTPISESEFWCSIPKSYIIIVVFTFDVGYWSRHWTITWKATTVSKTMSENTKYWNASHWVPLHTTCVVVNGNVRNNDCYD